MCIYAYLSMECLCIRMYVCVCLVSCVYMCICVYVCLSVCLFVCLHLSKCLSFSLQCNVTVMYSFISLFSYFFILTKWPNEQSLERNNSLHSSTEQLIPPAGDSVNVTTSMYV